MKSIDQHQSTPSRLRVIWLTAVALTAVSTFNYAWINPRDLSDEELRTFSALMLERLAGVIVPPPPDPSETPREIPNFTYPPKPDFDPEAYLAEQRKKFQALSNAPVDTDFISRPSYSEQYKDRAVLYLSEGEPDQDGAREDVKIYDNAVRGLKVRVIEQYRPDPVTGKEVKGMEYAMIANRLIVELNAEENEADFPEFLSRQNGRVIPKSKMSRRRYLVEFPWLGWDILPEKLSAFAGRADLFESVTENLLGNIEETFPNDPQLNLQIHLHDPGDGDGDFTEEIDINAPGGWDFQSGAANLVVAVIDTGIRLTHVELNTNLWTNPAGGPDLHGFDFVNNDNDPTDDNNHGTNVAGLIGAQGNNGSGISGVA